MNLVKNKKPKIRIKTKMKIIILVLLLPLLTIYTLEIKKNYENKIFEHTKGVENLVNLIGNFFENIFENTWFLQREIGKGILGNIDIEEDNNYLRSTTSIKKMKELINEIKYIENISLFDKNGNYIIGANIIQESEKEFAEYNEKFKDSYIYSQFLRGKTQIISNENKQFKNGNMHIATSIKDKNQNDVLIVCKVNLEKFENEKFTNSNEIYGSFGIVDNNNNIVYSQGFEEGTLNEEDLNTLFEERETITGNIKKTEWKAYSQGYLTNYKNELKKEVSMSIKFLITVVVIILIISKKLTDDVVNGTNYIRKIVEEIAKNKKMNRTSMKKNDEIGEIGEGINLIVDQLESFDKERNKLSLIMAHELRTPLNIMYSSIQLLEQINKKEVENSNKETINRYYKLIKENCYRLNKLVNNITISTQISANKLEINKKNVEIISSVEDLVNIVINNVNVIKERDIEVIFDTECESCILACDYKKINQVILNILSNAIKFTKNNSKVLIRMVENESYLEISIIDDGKGISEEAINKIFEKYTNGEEVLSRSAEGIGLGLYISKYIVEAHDGKIEIESELNQGALVRIKLPKYRLPSSENEVLYIKYDEAKIKEKVKIEFSDVY